MNAEDNNGATVLHKMIGTPAAPGMLQSMSVAVRGCGAAG
jgi:hypothetical protein